jgi:hypothetical protein
LPPQQHESASKIRASSEPITESDKEIAAVVDEYVYLHEKGLQAEAHIRELREKLVEMGRPDVARKFLSAPKL